eukprot:m.152573 g.152573  ORF g.152573 m.152573 type:complete len:1745 (-) comp14262_c0_seq1:1421-6655(-)
MDWIALQRKIFTRWVNQRLGKKHYAELGDVVTDLGEGNNLLRLVEILSERECTAKVHANPKFKAQKLENVNSALTFMYEGGVEMTLKPSAENLLDGDERAVLGLVWALMMKYLKFAQEDDVNLSPKDALLNWVNLNTAGHANAEVTNFKSSFHNGLALCALIHKFRPELIDYDALNPEEGDANLQIAMKAAETYFGLEQYLTPADVKKLDEKSMLVYVSEYYAGITEQMKLDLAFRRIRQLIEFTMTNDGMKAQYDSDATSLKSRIAKAEELLKTMPQEKDNTMKGARELLRRFNAYRSQEKRALYSDHIKLEALFTNLATRLADNSRPSYAPSDASLGVDQRAVHLTTLQETEQAIGLQLHEEVSHQLRLLQQNQEHNTRCEQVIQWIREHEAGLPAVESVTSSGQASNLLKFLEVSAKEIGNLKSTSFTAIQRVSAKLAEAQFENLAEAHQREQDLLCQLDQFAQLLTDKKPAFEDAFKRELFKEETQRSVSVHADLCKQIQGWAALRREYLKTKETITSLEDAELQVSLLQAFDKEKGDMVQGSVTELKTLGQSVRDAKYNSAISSWSFPTPDALTSLESGIDQEFSELTQLSAEKLKVLEDDVAREKYARATRLLADQHATKAEQLKAWAQEKDAYLAQREVCNTEKDARLLIGLLDAYDQEMVAMTSADYTSFLTLGKTIHARKYETSYSSYVYEEPAVIDAREQELQQIWEKLNAMSQERRPFLDDHLARNQFQNKIRLWVRTHSDSYKLLTQWYGEKKKFLSTKETVENVRDAQFHLGLLDAFRQEKTDLTSGSVAALKQLGGDIRVAEYKTDISQWVYEHPDQVSALEQEIEGPLWQELDQLAQAKQRVLDDDLAREQFKEKTRLQVKNHQAAFGLLQGWCEAKIVYLNTKEVVTNSELAKEQLSHLNLYEKTKVDMTAADVAALNSLGDAIRAAEYKTEISQWVYEKPEEVTALETRVTEYWQQLDGLSAEKRRVLDDDLARELYAEATRLQADQHKDTCSLLSAWVSAKSTYLQVRETVDTTEDARFHLSVLEAFQKEKQALTATSLASFHELGKTVLARKYETSYSSYVYEEPNAIKTRESDLAAPWNKLDEEAKEKLTVLDDHLKRNIFQDEVRLSVDIHKDTFNKIQGWVQEKQAYLAVRETIDTVQQTDFHTSLLSAFEQEKKDTHSSQVAALTKRGDEIRASKYETSLSQWVYEKPDEVTALESQVQEMWNQMDAGAAAKQAFLDDCNARNLLKAKVLLLVDRHNGVFERVQQWVARKKEFLGAPSQVDSLASAAVSLRLLTAFESDRDNLNSTTVASLSELGQEIVTTKYQSDMSAWGFGDPATISTREQAINSEWQVLAKMVAEKRAVLLADEEREKKKEDLRQEFAHAAQAMRGFVRDTNIFIQKSLIEGPNKATAYGFSLDETIAFEAELQKEDQELRNTTAQKKAASLTVLRELETFGAVVNPYTDLDAAGLDAVDVELGEVIASRSKHYKEALEEQRQNDQLCREFADGVNPLATQIRTEVEKLTRPEGSLEEQLAAVNSQLASVTTQRDQLQQLKELEAKMTARSINFNPHCNVTLEDIESQISDYVNILEYKKPLLEQEIDFKKSRGVTKERLQEIEDFFKQFDTDGSGVIDKKELKACMYSLSEELTTAEVEQLMTQFGSGGKLNLAQFRELMINQVGVSHTQEHIIKSFLYVSREEETVEVTELAKRLSKDHLDFLCATSAPADNRLDFQAITESLFAR